MNLDDIADGYLEESEVDYVDLWQIAQAAREDLGAHAIEDVINFSLYIVRRLYEGGLMPGDYWGGDFDYWPNEGCQAALDRIEREWIKMGTDPNLAEPICWFAPRRE